MDWFVQWFAKEEGTDSVVLAKPLPLRPTEKKNVLLLQLVGPPQGGKTSFLFSLQCSANNSFTTTNLAYTPRFAQLDESVGATKAATRSEPITLSLAGFTFEIVDIVGGDSPTSIRSSRSSS
jgi:hypothetical protein